jgi:transglutaminase-like putative cysteine protease
MQANPATARFHVLHETRYQYVVPVSLSQQLLYLRPRTFQFQQCHSYSLRIDPVPGERHEALDYFGNHRQYLAITQPHDHLSVSSESTLSLTARPGQELLANSVAWELVRDSLRKVGDPTRLEPIKYLFESPHVALIDEVHAYALQSFTPGRSVLDAAFDLTLKINREFSFDPEATDISTPLSELMRIRRGVCQDFAHLMIGCLRSVGVPCRYVSGYILTNPPPGKPRLVGADASHAWVSVYCPSIGWVDFDPTNRCMVNLEHITLGWGRDFSDVSLLRGVLLGGGAQTLEVSVTVTPQSSMQALSMNQFQN